MRHAHAMPGWLPVLLLLLVLLAAPGAQAVPLQVYGQLPHLEEMALSPDGTRIAFVKTEGNVRIISVGITGAA